MHSDLRLSVKTIGEDINFTHKTVYRILTSKLEMRKICAKNLSENLSPFHTAISINEVLAFINIPGTPQLPINRVLKSCNQPAESQSSIWVPLLLKSGKSYPALCGFPMKGTMWNYKIILKYLITFVHNLYNIYY